MNKWPCVVWMLGFPLIKTIDSFLERYLLSREKSSVKIIIIEVIIQTTIWLVVGGVLLIS